MAIKVNLLDTDSRLCRLLTVIEISVTSRKLLYKKLESGLTQLIKQNAVTGLLTLSQTC